MSISYFGTKFGWIGNKLNVSLFPLFLKSSWEYFLFLILWDMYGISVYLHEVWAYKFVYRAVTSLLSVHSF